MNRYDIVLVLGYFRSATAYLSIIRHFAPRLRIALLPAVVDPSFLANNQRAQATFLELCQQFGAEVVQQGTPIDTTLMVVQQFIYPEDTVKVIMSTVQAEKRVGLMLLAMAGRENHDVFLSQFAIKRIYVQSRRFFEFLIDRRQARSRYDGIDVVEVGLPYAKYPVFPEFQADYLIAAPTVFSFSTERGKHSFLHAVLRLLDQIPATEVVVYKPHNGRGRDYFAPKFHYALARMLMRTPGGRYLTVLLLDRLPAPLNKHIERLQTCVLHLQVLNRATPLSEITPYAEISLEAFLPGVCKGVIGGLSNTIWGTLYFRLPFFNCVDPALRKDTSDFVQRKSEDLLDMNLQYFGVPYCGGDLSKGSRGESIVYEMERQGDLISAINAELMGSGFQPAKELYHA